MCYLPFWLPVYWFTLSYFTHLYYKTLGYSTLMAGIVISLQYVATFLTRGWSGTLIDKYGPRLSVYISMGCLALSGVLLYLTYLSRSQAFFSLLILIIARLVTGCGEGFIGASLLTGRCLLQEKNRPLR
ncbi:hypothetical protein [Arachidicoccus ginsenosidivorans]|uniref:hypothetical protein n=1 Tax=Arachidicoccus ginsenosidivorans TaxID=496057 RepID=UPI001CEF632D|nr:hypothetical protein [Arachidicoccus ginsenosidivorans]